MALKILIADDEKEARELLLHYLREVKNILVKECADGQTALQLIEEFQPHILFLDIKMPSLDGMEVMQQKTSSDLPAVIFTTAYDKYALPAFDYEVLDYLLKPFEKQRFERALKRAMDYVDFVHSKKTTQYISQLPVKTGGRTELIDVDDIFYFQAEGAYVQVFASNKTWLITEPVYELETLLDPQTFARVHRSVIVQVNAVRSIQSLLNGDHILLLKNGKEIRASRTYKEKIKKWKER